VKGAIYVAAKSSTFDNDLLKLIFNASAIANIADNAASSPLTNLYLALHTATPAVGGSQTTNEAAYTSYARVAVARSSGGFTVSGATVVLAALTSFPAATGGSETETYFSVGTASTGTGKVLYFGPISPTIVVASGVTPQLTTGTTITES
jgi:hypothetical protein